MKKIPEGFKKVCSLSELKDGMGKQIFIEDIEIALFKIDDEVFALSNICPHQQTHLIHEGYIENGKVVCPVHGWMFDLRTGNIAEYRRGLQPYEVMVIDTDIYVKALDKKVNW